MAKLYLALVFHNHQPVGNFDHVFREAYDRSYIKLIELLERHPQVKAGMHFTGCLRDWLLDNEAGIYGRVRVLVERGQLEVLGGAYYEPILPILSDEDKIGQIRKLAEAVESDVGQQPTGMWLAERVWEPSLAKPIAQAGMRYTIVDDTHFMYTGFKESELYGYFVTEEQGYTLNMFPTSTTMRYLFPWKPVDELMTWLKSVAEQGGGYGPPPLVVMGDDGEKFGLWPGTYAHMWEQGYMDEAFEAIVAASDWLETITPSEYMRQFPALGRAYLPTASYMEMTEWALPPQRSYELTQLRHEIEDEIEEKKDYDPGRVQYLEKVRSFLRGGLWRNFLVKYPEINHMQKRAMYTSRRVNALPDSAVKSQALSYLWAAQCNCAYWHGVFGGIYLYHIRAKNYENLLNAEALILDDKVHYERIDFDQDSRDELVVTGAPFSLIFDLAQGGSLIEWDDLPSRYNLLNIMTRHREGYHENLARAATEGTVITPDSPQWGEQENIHSTTVRAKELGLEHYLIVDWHRRGSFIDHFLRADADLDSLARSYYGEEGDFVVNPYTLQASGDGSHQAVITLSRDGQVWHQGEQQPVRVEKRIALEAGKRELVAEYTVTNQADAALHLRFAIEMAYGFDGGDSEHCYVALEGQGVLGNLGMTAAHEAVSNYRVATKIRGFEVAVTSEQATELWHFPLEPVTISEGGFEKIHQGAIFLHLYHLTLEPGADWSNTLRFTLHDIDRI
ncbi:MAG: DUF1926 domain-containing protein [Chloroflexi bacterium]|nr:MAG: DUF1926 domain-containing protein [Chloroflexota bacterium]